jgi:hypothetical protein
MGKVVLSSRDEPQSLKIELYGDLARILALCGINDPNERQPGLQEAGCQFSVVAGTRYSHYSHCANELGYDCRKLEARRQIERRVPNADEEDRP